MGSCARMHQGERFIEEFGEDFHKVAEKEWGLKKGALYELVGHGLVFTDGDEDVRYEIELRRVGAPKDEETTFAVLYGMILYCECVDDDEVSRVAHRLGIDESLAMGRFRKVGLVEEAR